MIVHQRPRFWQLFSLMRLSVLPRIGWQLFAATLLSVVVIVVEKRAPHSLPGWGVAPFTLLGVALSIFLGFRNNACYDRWWEARRQLGALISDTRSLARLAVSIPGTDVLRTRRIVRGTIGYVYALMAHLRRQPQPPEVAVYAPHVARFDAAQNLPEALLRELAAEFGRMLGAHEIGEQIFCAAEQRLGEFGAVQAACERIRGTPTPFPYTLLIHRTSYAYCFLLPFGLASTMSWGMPVFCALVAYTFFGLDAIGDDLEEPFGSSLNALPLNAMARTVEISLLEAIDAENIPSPLQPMRSVLQ